MIWLWLSQTREFRQRLLWYVGKKLTTVVILFRFYFSPLTKAGTRTPEKTANILRRHWFCYEMMSEDRRPRQKIHTDDASLPRSGECFWLVVPRGKFASTNQKHHPDVCSDTSSVWNFCARFSDVIFRGNHWWRWQMSAAFSGYEQESDSTFFSHSYRARVRRRWLT